jgi:predicted membrane metal-binding protein
MTDKPTFHENLAQRDDVKVGSERSFGLVFTVVFIIIALFPLLTVSDQEGTIRVWALIVAAFFTVTALTMPRFLAPLNKLWFHFGLLLHKIVSPLVMGLLFFVTVTPIGLLMRTLGKTPLKLEFDKDADSYWILRDPPGPAPDTMKRQF